MPILRRAANNSCLNQQLFAQQLVSSTSFKLHNVIVVQLLVKSVAQHSRENTAPKEH